MAAHDDRRPPRPSICTVPPSDDPPDLDLDLDLDYQPTDPIVNASFSPYTPIAASASRQRRLSVVSHVAPPDEAAPLLPRRTPSKPFFRPRPLWLVPFAIVAATVRGMTLAPRVQVFTQLSCNAIYGHDVYDHTGLAQLAAANPPYYLSPHAALGPLHDPDLPHSDGDDDEPDPRAMPSHRCLSDPAVQSGAARIQTIMTTIGGVLSALTTGWWGHFGERHGRTRVLAASTLGLFLTDLTFILVSTPHSIFAAHGHKFLVVSPFIEGVLGGWATLQAATSAYVSDCTSDGSRAQIFSRFAGVFYLGFSLGPVLGAFLIRHPLAMPGFPSTASGGVHNGQPTVTSVFYAAAMCSFVNLLLVVFVFPESLDKKRAEAAREAAALGLDTMQDASGADAKPRGILARFFGPLAVFVPRTILAPDGTPRSDSALTVLGLAVFGYLLATGVFQIKYLYAGHVYAWGAEQLSYYISFVGIIRAVHLLFVMPYLIATFKPKPKLDPVTAHPAKKPKPTLAQLSKEVSFDLLLLRLSLFVEFLSHTLVTLAPATSSYGQAMFVAFTSLSSLASGVSPAANSLALSVMQLQSARAAAADGHEGAGSSKDSSSLGQLFAALSMLQAVGQTILGPVLFGVVYSATVAQYPKAVFALTAAILSLTLALVLALRPSQWHQRKPRQLVRAPYDPREDVERGRPRGSKDLTRHFGYSAMPVSVSSSGSSDDQTSYACLR